MKRHSQRHSLTTVSEINITPLLDLAFVLLIIFMITTPLLDKSVELVIPTSKAAENAVDPALVQTVSVNRDGVIALNQEPVDLEVLKERLAAQATATPGVAVVVRAHKELPVQQLVSVLDALKKAGITKIGVVTQPDGK